MKLVAICYSGQRKLIHLLVLDISPSGHPALHWPPSLTQRVISQGSLLKEDWGSGLFFSTSSASPSSLRQGSQMGHRLGLTQSLPPPRGQRTLTGLSLSHPEECSVYFNTSLAPPSLHTLHQLESRWGVTACFSGLPLGRELTEDVGGV